MLCQQPQGLPKAKATQVLTRGLNVTNVKQTPYGLQVPVDTSLVHCTTGCSQAADTSVSKPVRQPRRENTCGRQGRMSAHSVFVIGVGGKPLTPTTPAKARKLLKGGQAKRVWSKFDTFGIQLLADVRTATPLAVLGYDPGVKFEGIVTVIGTENVLAIKLDLPDKEVVTWKLTERRQRRYGRHRRNQRQRQHRLSFHKAQGWLPPSQLTLVQSRLKVLAALLAIYPVTIVGREDVRFNHARYRWGAKFAPVEIGKTRVREFFVDHDVLVRDYPGFETKQLRTKYAYAKTSNRAANTFGSHCSDALALACEAGAGVRITPGRFLTIRDTYRPTRRKLHRTQPSPGGQRAVYTTGSVFGLRKGLLIGTSRGKQGQLCGRDRQDCLYLDKLGKRQRVRAQRVAWISSHFICNEELGSSSRCC